MRYWQAWMAYGLLTSLPAAAQADIYRWDNGQLILGTQGITPGPGVYLGEWSSPQRNLRFADFSGGLDLTSTNFNDSWLDDSRFNGANLANASLHKTSLTNADLSGTNLTNASLFGANLTNADLPGTNLTNASLWFANLTNADLLGTNLSGASLGGSTLTNANFAGAVVAGVHFATLFGDFGELLRSDITLPQLYSTASYQQRNLRGIRLIVHDLTSGDFSEQDLTGADFLGSTLTSANFAGANLTNAELAGATLTNANFAGAMVAGARFADTTSRGFTKEQLYSTASYQQKDLRGIVLWDNNLTGWDFSGQDLTGAVFVRSTLTNANLSGTKLTDAQLGSILDHPGANLTNANFAGAVIAGANFRDTTSRGFTKDQHYSTASYQQRNLQGIDLGGNNLTGWDFSGQDLAGADFVGSILTNANFSFADLRGARMSSGPFQTRNTIREFGSINGLDLAEGETLVVRDSDIGITVNNSMNIVSGGTLELVLGDADWGSTMAVAAGVARDLGGTLRVRFADQANLASMVGATFDLFNWPAVLDTNNRFDAIELPPGTQWDLNQLYVTGTAKLTAIPEPSAVLLLAYGMSGLSVARRRIFRASRRVRCDP